MSGNGLYIRIIHLPLLTGGLDGSTEPQPPRRVRIPPTRDVNLLWRGDAFLETAHHVRPHVGVYALEYAEPVWRADGHPWREHLVPTLPLGGVLGSGLPPQVRREALCVYEPAVGEPHVSVPLAGGYGPGAVRECLLDGWFIMLGLQLYVFCQAPLLEPAFI